MMDGLGVQAVYRMSPPPFAVGQRLRLKQRVLAGRPRRWITTDDIRGRRGGGYGTVTKVSGAHWWSRSSCAVGPCVQVLIDGHRRPAWFWCGYWSPK